MTIHHATSKYDMFGERQVPVMHLYSSAAFSRAAA